MTSKLDEGYEKQSMSIPIARTSGRRSRIRRLDNFLTVSTAIPRMDDASAASTHSEGDTQREARRFDVGL